MNNPLHNSIHVLVALEKELHDKSEFGLAQTVREVIDELHQINLMNGDDGWKSGAVLEALGNLLSKLPQILELMDRFRG